MNYKKNTPPKKTGARIAVLIIAALMLLSVILLPFIG